MIVVQGCWRSLTAAAKSCSLPPAGPVTDTPHGTIMDTLWENSETLQDIPFLWAIINWCIFS